jgi:hypothetical protein
LIALMVLFCALDIKTRLTGADSEMKGWRPDESGTLERPRQFLTAFFWSTKRVDRAEVGEFSQGSLLLFLLHYQQASRNKSKGVDSGCV